MKGISVYSVPNLASCLFCVRSQYLLQLLISNENIKKDLIKWNRLRYPVCFHLFTVNFDRDFATTKNELRMQPSREWRESGTMEKKISFLK